MGYHPATGEELQRITKEVATEWTEQQYKTPPHPPKSVKLGIETDLFDPVSGAPILWFSRLGAAEYEFFDGPGFNPRTGEALKSFTREDASSYFEEVKKEADRLKAEQDRADQEKAKREQEDTIARQKRKDEQRKREAEARQRTESARECDELAGNPNDPRRVAAGIGFDLLKAHVQEAIKACDSAVQQNPTELRLRYEFARALSFTDRDVSGCVNPYKFGAIETEGAVWPLCF
jgi:hypothetical protein